MGLSMLYNRTAGLIVNVDGRSWRPRGGTIGGWRIDGSGGADRIVDETGRVQGIKHKMSSVVLSTKSVR